MIASIYGLTANGGLIDVHCLCRLNHFSDVRDIERFALRESEGQARHYDVILAVSDDCIKVINPHGGETQKTDAKV